MKIKVAFVLGALLSTSAFAGPNRAVKVGNENLDACLGSALVTASTTLFSFDPRTGDANLDVVNVNTVVMTCDYEKAYNGDYVGIIVQPEGVDCGLSSDKPRHDYTGPCVSGWVKKQFLEPIAGGGF